MPENDEPPSPPPDQATPPDAPPPAAARPAPPPPSGCLRWGLVGCLFLSILAIVGMVLFLRKAPELIDRLLAGPATRVLEAAEPGVPAAEKEAYRTASELFVAGAKSGKVTPDAIRDVQRRTLEALGDGKVTREELQGLTAALRSASR